MLGLPLGLEILSDNVNYYRKRAMKEELPVSKTFRDADSDWIKLVTGLDCHYRNWTSYTIEIKIEPRPDFRNHSRKSAKLSI